jgi:protein CpxP
MRKYLIWAAVAALFISPAAMAQQPAPQPAPQQPAPQPAPQQQLEPGANSFTEAQVRSRLEAAGYTNITDLRKDDQGIWRGKAMKDGRQVNVGMDFKGNIVAT